MARGTNLDIPVLTGGLAPVGISTLPEDAICETAVTLTNLTRTQGCANGLNLQPVVNIRIVGIHTLQVQQTHLGRAQDREDPGVMIAAQPTRRNQVCVTKTRENKPTKFQLRPQHLRSEHHVNYVKATTKSDNALNSCACQKTNKEEPRLFLHEYT